MLQISFKVCVLKAELNVWNGLLKAPSRSDSLDGGKCKAGDIIEMRVDLNQKQVSLTRNSRDYGVLFSNLQNEVRVVFGMNTKEDSISFLCSEEIPKKEEEEEEEQQGVAIAKEEEEEEEEEEVIAKEEEQREKEISIYWDHLISHLTNVLFEKSNLKVTNNSKEKGWKSTRSKEILQTGAHIFTIKINQLKRHFDKYTLMMIGVCDAHHRGINFKSPKGYMYLSYNRNLYNNNNVKKKYGEPWQAGDIIEVRIDTNQRQLSFKRNNQDYGVAFANLPNEVRLACDLFYHGDSISIIRHRKEEIPIHWDQFVVSNFTNVLYEEDNSKVTNNSRYHWRAIRSREIIKNGVHVYNIKVNQLGGKFQQGSIMIGVCDASHRGINNESPNGYMYYSYDGNIYNNNLESKYGEPWQVGDIIQVRIDMNQKQLSFTRNNQDYGVAFSNLPNEVRLACDLFYNGESISIIGSKKEEEEENEDDDEEELGFSSLF
ncbi:e3 ubiquitin-protein ligase herc2 [Anaeramoeba flamelloides]|uniref:E3 ubiquitin-protein ligase herc2 n=1 Tax=Anaeramoeba flamelloides TaxID=1746091 RepID=A0ABQ8ZED3_9EUKA|nr:e3 ubiquitin-protein ligase herc2 [Anaeramoeba flamelloides]